MSLYFIRHGATNYNQEGRIQGHIDIELADLGIKQAYDLHKELNDLKIDKIYCSPLIRVKQTCDIVNEVLQVKDIEYCEEIKERCFGDWEGQIVIPKIYMWDFNNSDVVPNGEDLNDFFKRIHTFLATIEDEIKTKNILIVAHGGVSLAILDYYGQLDRRKRIRDYMLEHGKLHKII